MTEQEPKITTKVGSLLNQSFSMTFQKLGHAQLDAHASYRIKRIVDLVTQEQDKYRDEFNAWRKTYAVLDDKGEVVPNEENPWGFNFKEGATKEAFDKEYDAFMKKPVVIDKWPLSLKHLSGAKISPAELKSIEDFILDPELEATTPESNVAQLRR